MPLGTSFGYPVKTADELGLTDYFRKNPKVAGMAWGGGLNGSDPKEPRAIVANPFNPNMADPNKMQGLLKIEAAVHLMDETGYVPEFELSEEQQEWRKKEFGKDEASKAYAEDDLALKKSIISRIGVDKVPGVTPEQKAEAARIAAMLDERENPDFIKSVMSDFNPLSEAGMDDLVEPAVVAGKQAIDHIKAAQNFVGKKPPKLNIRGLAAGTLGGVAAESATQHVFDATRGGQESDNPFVTSLEKLASRVVGGATSGALIGKNPVSAIVGAGAGAAVDAGENLYNLARTIPEFIDLYDERERQKTIALKGKQRSRSMIKSQ